MVSHQQHGAVLLHDEAELPVDYSDGVGEFAALGLPLLLFVATEARTLAGRALGAAGLPIVALCLALTVSRGGILASAVGLVTFFALVPDRLPRLATFLAAAAASAVVFAVQLHLADVRNASVHPAPAGQRDEMLFVLALACAASASAQVWITRAVSRRGIPPWLTVSRRRSRAIAALVLAIVLAVVLVAIASGTDNQLWQEFKQPTPPVVGNEYSRLLSIAGSHRYQYWQAAIAAFHVDPWKGIGPGTFEFYWAQHNTLAEFVRNAHSLWFETLAELGIIGLALIDAFFALVITTGAARALRLGSSDELAPATTSDEFSLATTSAEFSLATTSADLAPATTSAELPRTPSRAQARVRRSAPGHAPPPPWPDWPRSVPRRRLTGYGRSASSR